MKKLLKKAIGVIVITLCTGQLVFAQGNTYKLTGNNNGDANSKFGFKNAANLKTITNDSVRQTITKEGNVIIEKNLKVKGTIEVDNTSGQPVNLNGDLNVNGKIITDSIRVTNVLTVDSAHVRSLVIGDSSLWISAQPQQGVGDNIQSNNPSINFGRIYTVPTLDGFSKINIGVGMQNPHHKMQLYDQSQTLQPVHISFTNDNYTISQPPSPQGTGNLAADGFLVGISANGNAQLIQQENLPMQFLVNGSTTSTPLTRERMRITAGPQTINGEPEDNITRVGIWRTGATGNPNPLSLLQIGEPATPSLAGHRDWMDVGTYSNVRELNTYVGILSIKDSNRFDAIIDWGSPATTTASPPRSMRFIYTTSQTGTLLSADYQGLEASRWWSNGDEVRIGFGGNPVTNLYYNDSEDPTQTVEINSGAPDFSGLRFTDLREHSLHVPLNPDQGVLSVNEDGDVIYVDAAGGGGVDNDWFVAGTVSPNANIGDNIYTQGFTGLGDFSTIIPQSLLHLYQPDIALYAQFTNDNTGNTVADGFLAGINEDGVAQLNQQEDADMNFYTSNKLCLTITNKGKIKVNSFSSDKPHLLIADKDGTLMLCKLKKKEQKLPNLKHV